MKFAKPVIVEVTNFVIKDTILEKNVAIETKIVIIPVLMEVMVLVMADVTLVKNLVMA